MMKKSLLLSALTGVMMVHTAHSASVLMYGQLTAASDGPTLSKEQFTSHMELFKSGEYTLVSLDDLMVSLDKSAYTTISFSEGYKNAFDLGMIPLLEAQIPFALFITPNKIGTAGYMTWEQVNTLHRAGVSIGVNPNAKNNLTMASDARVRDNLEKTARQFQQTMGFAPKYVSYPFGNVSKSVMEITKDVGYLAGFSQYSGGFNHNSNLFNLPRFSLSRKYGSVGRLKQILASDGMPMTGFLPINPRLTPDNNPPALGFTFDFPVKYKANLNCYHSQLGKVQDIKWLGDRRVEVRFPSAFKTGSSRLNCTMPSKEPKRWYWLGQQFYVPK